MTKSLLEAGEGIGLLMAGRRRKREPIAVSMLHTYTTWCYFIVGKAVFARVMDQIDKRSAAYL